MDDKTSSPNKDGIPNDPERTDKCRPCPSSAPGDEVDPLLASAVAAFADRLDSETGKVDIQAFCHDYEATLSPEALEELGRLAWVAKQIWLHCNQDTD